MRGIDGITENKVLKFKKKGRKFLVQFLIEVGKKNKCAILRQIADLASNI